MDTLALAVSASANYILRHKEAQRMMLPLVAFPICGLLDLFCIYHELKAVQLRSLNRERAEMVAQHWLEQGKVRGLGEAFGFWTCQGLPGCWAAVCRQMDGMRTHACSLAVNRQG
jgi:hypothetical protein